jgi:hypothetical protein
VTAGIDTGYGPWVQTLLAVVYTVDTVKPRLRIYR